MEDNISRNLRLRFLIPVIPVAVLFIVLFFLM